jgi:hypothetical protein
VDNTYSYGLVLIFKDTDQHNLYQADPIHQIFLDKNAAKWTRVLVFDLEMK